MDTTNEINKIKNGGGKSLAGISNQNVTHSDASKNRAVPHNKSDVPPK